MKTPRDSTIRTGHTARLECAAEGHPAPQIAWQKDGGTDFPAARERRMHVMPDDDVFFITDVKAEDAGLYSCTARNSAGTASANATLTVLGEDGSARYRSFRGYESHWRISRMFRGNFFDKIRHREQTS